MGNELLRVVEPFTVEILDRTDSNIIVKLPSVLMLEDGSTLDLNDAGPVSVDVSSKTNENHNLKRDVRSVLREKGILVSYVQQYKLINVLN